MSLDPLYFVNAQIFINFLLGVPSNWVLGSLLLSHYYLKARLLCGKRYTRVWLNLLFPQLEINHFSKELILNLLGKGITGFNVGTVYCWCAHYCWHDIAFRLFQREELETSLMYISISISIFIFKSWVHSDIYHQLNMRHNSICFYDVLILTVFLTTLTANTIYIIPIIADTSTKKRNK